MAARIVSVPWALSGIVLWAAHFTVVYGYTAVACARGNFASIVWTVSFTSALAGCATAFVVWRSSRRKPRDWLSGGIAALALLAIVLEGLPAWLVPPCA